MRRGLRPVREILRPLEVHRLAVRRDQHDRLAIGRRAWSAARRGCYRTLNRCPRRRDHHRRRRRRVHAHRRPRSSRLSRSRSASSDRPDALRTVVPFVHEQRLAVRAELGRRHAGARLVQHLRVGRAERRRPCVETILAARGVPVRRRHRRPRRHRARHDRRDPAGTAAPSPARPACTRGPRRPDSIARRASPCQTARRRGRRSHRRPSSHRRHHAGRRSMAASRALRPTPFRSRPTPAPPSRSSTPARGTNTASPAA